MVLTANHQGGEKMATEVDARGLPCPQPVINTKKALEEIEEGTVTVLVDSAESRENVQRFAQSQGCQVEVAERNGAFCLAITKEYSGQAGKKQSGDVVLITGTQLGTGDDSFGERLMISFINTLGEATSRPARLIFANSGVKLTAEGSEVLETLQRLEQEGVQILSCGTCPEFYHLADKLRAGIVTNSYEVVDSLLSAGKVIKI
jgi:selenium metabolism protein YedF